MSTAAGGGRLAGGLTTVLRRVYRSGSRHDRQLRRLLRPGDRVGTLELVRVLGRGGSGSVYEAYDHARRQRVAVKVLDAIRGRLTTEDRARREAEAITALAHPNIVRVLRSGRCDAGRYLVLELLQGSALAVRLERGPLPFREALRISTEVARAMAHAHAHGIVHRDLTPGNVFLCADGTVKVLDFGIAHLFGRRKIEGGTSEYMAPEQVRGAPEDERTDVFALGVMLLHMLSRRMPLQRRSARAPTARDVQRVEAAATPALATLVRRMLSDDPVRRPRDGAAVLAQLNELWRNGYGARDTPGDVIRATFSWLRRTPRRRQGDLETSVGSATSAAHFPPAADPEAHRDFLIGRQFRSRGATRDNLRRAIASFERALSRDPRHAAAWAALADAVHVAGDHAATPAELTDLQTRALRAAERAVALDPSLPDGYRQRAILRRSMFDWAGARADLTLARRLSPGDPSTSREEGRLVAALGQTRQAIELLHEAITLDPLDARSWYFLGAVQAGSGDLVRARQAYRRAWDVAPDSVGAPFGLGVIALLERDPAAALLLFTKAGDMGRALGAVLANHDLGRSRRSDHALATLRGRYALTAPCTVAKAHARRGELGSAFALLDRAISRRDPALAALSYDPLLEIVRLDARYRALRRSMNLPVRERRVRSAPTAVSSASSRCGRSGGVPSSLPGVTKAVHGDSRRCDRDVHPRKGRKPPSPHRGRVRTGG